MNKVSDLGEKELRHFGFVFGAILPSVFGILLPLLLGRGFALWPWAAGGVFVLWALAAPATLRPLYRGWMFFGQAMNFVMSRIVLGAVFYLVVLPTGLILKFRGRDPMHRAWDASAASYRLSSRVKEPKSMERPF